MQDGRVNVVCRLLGSLPLPLLCLEGTGNLAVVVEVAQGPGCAKLGGAVAPSSCATTAPARSSMITRRDMSSERGRTEPIERAACMVAELPLRTAQREGAGAAVNDLQPPASQTAVLLYT